MGKTACGRTVVRKRHRTMLTRMLPRAEEIMRSALRVLHDCAIHTTQSFLPSSELDGLRSREAFESPHRAKWSNVHCHVNFTDHALTVFELAGFLWQPP